MMHVLFQDAKARPVLAVAAACTLLLFFTVYCVTATGSLVLMGCLWLVVFSLFSLASAVVAIVIRRVDPTTQYSFGYARAPVLSVFASTVLAQLAALFLVKEAVEKLLEEHEHSHPHRLFVPAALAASLAQLLAAYAVHNEPFTHVITAASSSWLQEHAADLSTALCQVVPGVSRFLLPRLNPLALLTFVSLSSALLSHVLLVQNSYWWADSVIAILLSFAIIGTMWPLSNYTGRILLQTAPPHLITQLDRCLNEAGTLEGVLELTGAHFWQLDFNRMTGTVNVRVRRDADEQVVLAHVVDKLHPVVANLTVQVVKDADLFSSGVDYAHPEVDGGSSCSGGGDHHGHSHGGGAGHGHSHAGGDSHGHSHGATTDSHAQAPSQIAGGGHGHSHGAASVAEVSHHMDAGGHGHSEAGSRRSHSRDAAHHGHSHDGGAGHGHSH